jgi:outer membrane scaffolding protein for murein synthesis (MipA/OmpV family)
MKKGMGVGFAAFMVAGVMGAQAASEPEVSVEVPLLSSYVFRGMVLNNDAVVQPQVTIEHYGVSFNIWGNYNLGSDVNRVSGDFSEIDYTIGYALPISIDDLAISVGLTHYSFPNVTDSITGNAAESTTEIFAKGTLTTFDDLAIPVIPSLTNFGDVDEVNGTYFLFDVTVPYDISDTLSAECGVSAGYGNTAYNDAYFGQGIDADWNDFNFKGALTYAVTEDLTASFNLTYTALNGGAIRDGANANYEAKDKIWGGLSIAYDF